MWEFAIHVELVFRDEMFKQLVVFLQLIFLILYAKSEL